jgi:hypothetical protein
LVRDSLLAQMAGGVEKTAYVFDMRRLSRTTLVFYLPRHTVLYSPVKCRFRYLGNPLEDMEE